MMAVPQTELLPRQQVVGDLLPPTANRHTLSQLWRTLLRRQTASPATESQNHWLAEVIDTWCAANFWSLEQLAALASGHSSRGKITLLRELEDIRLHKAIYPSPRLFQALAAAHAAVHGARQPGPEDLEPGLRYATPITTEPIANRASWWFALYCQEDWAREAVTLPLQWDCPTDLSNRLAGYLRRQIVESGLDPVSDGLHALRSVFGTDPALLNRLNLWLLGLREMDRQELHSRIHQLLHVARNCGAAQTTVLELLLLLQEA